MNNFFDIFVQLRDSKIFTATVVTVILASAIYAGANTYDISDEYSQALYFFDYAITIFFTIEIIIRLLAERPFYKFFRNGWNIFDFIILSISLIPVGGSETVFVARLLRIIRILRIMLIQVLARQQDYITVQTVK